MGFLKKLLGRDTDVSPGPAWAPPQPTGVDRADAPSSQSSPPAAAPEPPLPPVIGIVSPVYGGHEMLEVVGESYRQANLWRIVGCEPCNDRIQHACHAVLIAETDNIYDANAISVWVEGLQVGFLSRDDAADYRPGLMRLAEHGPVALAATIVGGGRGGPPLLGIFLDHDPTDFGLTGPPAWELRTGLSEAFATDLADDSYDLSWFQALPDDTRRAASKLQELLDHDPDPIDRHFMFSELEARLYRLRDVEPDALSDYDRICQAHDAEMVTIRPALCGKFGKMPLLETYKQQAIRQQKAKNWAEGRRWARRGLEVYGEDASSQDWVDDLRKREASFIAKLAPPLPRQPKATTRTMTATEVETLTCNRCGVQWQRPRTRGRKPRLCEACRALE